MMVKRRLVSRGYGLEVRREQVDLNAFVIVVCGDGWAEWAIEIKGKIAAESDAIYGGIASALRDGLVYAECERVLIDPEGNGNWQLSKWPEAITEWPVGSRPTRPEVEFGSNGRRLKD